MKVILASLSVVGTVAITYIVLLYIYAIVEALCALYGVFLPTVDLDFIFFISFGLPLFLFILHRKYGDIER